MVTCHIRVSEKHGGPTRTAKAPEARPIPAWGEAPRMRMEEPRGPEARPIPASIPKVSFLPFDPIPLQEGSKFILICLVRMMRLLRIDVMDQCMQIRRPNRKRAISTLPRKLRQLRRLALEPPRGGRFQLRNEIRNIGLTVQTNCQVDVVGDTAHPKTFALVVANDRCEIGMEVRPHSLIQNGCTVLRAEDHLDMEKCQRPSHSEDYRSDPRPSCPKPNVTWGFAPRWYIGAPPALLHYALLLGFVSFVVGCKAPAPPAQPAAQAQAAVYPARPTVAPPAIKVFHQDNDTYTLVTRANATDDEIAAILWEFHNAAHTHSFDKLGLSQKFIDARKPIVWIHVYRGAKCASEKYTSGKLPCDASYHGAGDYTFGDYKNPQWDSGILHHADHTETQLWDSDALERP